MSSPLTSPSGSSLWFAISMGLIGLIVGYILAAGMEGIPDLTRAAGPTGEDTDTPPPPIDTPATADNDPVLGNADAPITLIEFSDFQCPFCRRFYRETYAKIKREYIDTGKVQLVYRDFPLSFHPGALPSALAMECAHDQSNALAWAVHDTIFDEQEKSGPGTVTYTAEDIKTWVASIRGLNMKLFQECLDGQKHKEEIDKDIADGSAAGIDGTPGFWILGPDGQSQKISGAYPFETFQAAFEGML